VLETLFNAIFGKKTNAEKSALESVAREMIGTSHRHEGQGYLSQDGVIGIYPSGFWQRRFEDLVEKKESELMEREDLLGFGKSWFDRSRFSDILNRTSNMERRILICERTPKPAIVSIGNAEIVIAPKIK